MKKTEKKSKKTRMINLKALHDLGRFTYALLAPPKKQTVSEWADENRVLTTEYSAEPGRWRTSRAPYQREIMDAFTQPGIWQIVIMASAQVGKALDIMTPILMPSGMKLMRDIVPGDKVFDENGDECTVLAVSPIWENRPCYELSFSDGTYLVADENHLWTVDQECGERRTISTGEVFAAFGCEAFFIPAVKTPSGKHRGVIGRRKIINICPVKPRPTKCIMVNSKSHLFLAGRSMVPTHNSEIELNMMGSAIANDPGPMIYIQPTEGMAEDYSKRRIAPMIAACPQLRDKVFKAKGRDSQNTLALKSFPGGSLSIIGANSPAELASRPIRYVFMDEIDRFPVSAGTEGDPRELAIRRTETFRQNRKVVKTSTPTIKGKSNIERDYMTGTQEEWQTECPFCHEWSFIRFENIKFDKEEFKDSQGQINYRVKRVVWKCPCCEREVEEHQAKRQPGKWVVKNEKALENGIRSFRLNAFMSPWSDWKDIVWTFLKAGKDPELLKTWHNTVLGESWEARVENGLETKLYNRREHYDAEVPSGVLLLTMGIDTQDNRLEYEVVGWDRMGQSWGISRGVIPGRADAPGVWDEVDALLEKEWTLRNGMKLRILATFMDSGGHHTSAVYKECARRQSKRIWPIKGEPGEGKPECRPMKRSGGVTESAKFMLGVDAGKSGIMYEAGIDEPGPHYMHFPLDYRAGYDLEYFKGLISERMEIHRRGGKAVVTWAVIHERNEPLDCRNYARAAYRYFHWRFDDFERALRGEDLAPKIETRRDVERKRSRRVVSRGISV